MSKILILMGVMLAANTTLACIGPDVTEEESVEIQNELAMEVINEAGIPIKNVTKVRFAPGFILTRGQKGSCSALNAFGLIMIETSYSCSYKAHVNTTSEGVEFEISKRCEKSKYKKPKNQNQKK